MSFLSEPGDLAQTPLAAILLEALNQHATGVLEVVHGGGTSRLWFREGRPVGAQVFQGFRPLGMMGEKKLKNLFIDRKIPVSARGRIPLFLCRGEIFWVGGVQPADVACRPVEVGGLLRLQLAGSPE